METDTAYNSSLCFLLSHMKRDMKEKAVKSSIDFNLPSSARFASPSSPNSRATA